jgi:extracellular factor (EF) 3-hydroxypalmitic acid methyl ester biosynthesis protein
MGLFDYLTMPVARAVLARLYDLLEPGGVLLVGNFHPSNPSRVYMEYWGDWKLLYRNEESMLELAQDLPGASASIGFDETRCQMFLRVEGRQ